MSRKTAIFRDMGIFWKWKTKKNGTSVCWRIKTHLDFAPVQQILHPLSNTTINCWETMLNPFTHPKFMNN